MRQARKTARAIGLHLIAASLWFGAPSKAKADPRDWDRASDVAVLSLVGWSLGVPLVQGDRTGAVQAGGSIASAYAGAFVLKRAFPETRPDGSDSRSFPSGHTSAAFAAATSILERRGPAEGVPALAVASFVGVARVKADKHHWHDVLAGAALGSAAGLLLTSPRERSDQLMVWASPKSVTLGYAARF